MQSEVVSLVAHVHLQPCHRPSADCRDVDSGTAASGCAANGSTMKCELIGQARERLKSIAWYLYSHNGSLALRSQACQTRKTTTSLELHQIIKQH